MNIYVTWDTTSEDEDGNPPPLPTLLNVPAEIDPNEDGAVTDWLSDTFGWLVLDWKPART